MQPSRPEIFARLFETPLLIDAGKAATIVESIGPRILGENNLVVIGAEAVGHIAFQNGRPSSGLIGDRLGRAYDRRGERPYDMVGAVAVIPIEGTLVHKGAFVGASSGQTSYQGLQTQIIRAAADPLVRGVAFEVDSFGGEVSGLFETARMISELSKHKPTLSILTDYALSAGYALASGARQIVMPRHGEAGSIGAIQLHADMSRALEKKGVKVTVLRSGSRKADTNPYEPLPPAALAEHLEKLERIRQSFATHVGENRGRRFNANQALASEGASFDGADAVMLGLADALAHPHEAFDEFVRQTK